ncbi:MAG TPA: hypothetical protein P5169_05855 [Kiritimatiellia bacterium]|jgi:hypothetical protein|nr:hypothetical protein [Lentisphaerota bacterium]HRV31215.1 hypothetical protein [Kiritimatiellia bacterium]
MRASFAKVGMAAAILALAGCANRHPLDPVPLGQSALDQFLNSGRDARQYGITTYRDAAGVRYEFANRPHPERSAQLDFAPPRNSRLPVVMAKSAITSPFPMLVDTSARQTWAAMSSGRALEYRVFAPATGEYPDHVSLPLPGYAGVGNKLILDKLHIESPIYFMPPAGGMLGPLSRVANPADHAAPALKKREELARRIPVVMGAAALRNFSFVSFDFPRRKLALASTRDYRPRQPAAVAVSLPMLDWRGRPAFQAQLDNEPMIFVVDTAGEFGVVLPGAATTTGTLILSSALSIPCAITSPEEKKLPPTFPARVGLDVLSKYIVTLDYKKQRIWFENPALQAASQSVDSSEDKVPVHYRGVSP